MKSVALIAFALLLAGCAPTTKINIPEIGTYQSDKNIEVTYSKDVDGSLKIHIIGDASSVIDSRGAAAAGIMGASTQLVDVAAKLAMQAAAAQSGVPLTIPKPNANPNDYTFPTP